MPTNQHITELKNQIKMAIRHSSDRGFVPYSGCNRVCGEMMLIMQTAEWHVKDRDYQQHFFDTIIKTVKNKAFKEWSEQGYQLLKSAVYFVQDQKQAQKIYDLFPVLGAMYDGEDYPDRLLKPWNTGTAGRQGSRR